MTFSERFYTLRRDRGYTQTSLAKAAKISLRTINAIERGETRDVNLRTARAISLALGRTIDDIFYPRNGGGRWIRISANFLLDKRAVKRRDWPQSLKCYWLMCTKNMLNIAQGDNGARYLPIVIKQDEMHQRWKSNMKKISYEEAFDRACLALAKSGWEYCPQAVHGKCVRSAEDIDNGNTRCATDTYIAECWKLWFLDGKQTKYRVKKRYW